MLTPRGLAEVIPEIHAQKVARGDTDPPHHTMLEVRSLCLGIIWLAEGIYAWITDAERAAIDAMAERLKTAPRPANGAQTPEERARDLIARFETMDVEDDTGLNDREVLDLCQALEQLATATYPYPLTAQAQAVHAERRQAA